VRQQHFAAWRRQTDQERYSALETVHNMSLQRLLNQNKELAVDVSFDPIRQPQRMHSLRCTVAVGDLAAAWY
jgi:hypothetical protein